MTARPRKAPKPAPAPSSPRFTKSNRSSCTKMTISCEKIVCDSSNAMRLWIISPRFPLNCDIFGTGEVVYRPTSPFLHNLSSFLYRHSGWHRGRLREGTGSGGVGSRRAQPRDAKRPGRVGFNRPAPRAFALILKKSFAEVWGHAAEAAYGRWPMPPSSVMVSPLMNLKSGPQS